MTDVVPTNGFIVPPTNVDASTRTVDVPPAAGQTPGYVDPKAAAPAAAVPVPPVGNNADFMEAIAALTEALSKGKPAEAAKPEPSKAEPVVSTDPASLNNYDINAIEDPILKSMVTVMQTVGKGIDMDRVFSKAIEHGDPNLLDVAYLREKGGDSADQLVTIAQGIIQAINAQSAKVTSEIMEQAGGEANWHACAAAFNQSAPTELRQVCAVMLDSGNADQIKAASKLIVEFAKGSGIVPVAKPTLQSGAVAPTGQALSKAEFQAELRKLNSNEPDYYEKRNDLYTRRQIGKRLGK